MTAFNTLFGLPVITSSLIPDEVPKLSLHPDAPVGDKFRAEMNQWLLDMFGTKKVAFVINGKQFVIHPKNFAILDNFK